MSKLGLAEFRFTVGFAASFYVALPWLTLNEHDIWMGDDGRESGFTVSSWTLWVFLAMLELYIGYMICVTSIMSIPINHHQPHIVVLSLSPCFICSLPYHLGKHILIAIITYIQAKSPFPSRYSNHHHQHHHQLLGFLPSHPKKNQILNPFHLIESHILSREIRLNFRNKNESSLLFYSHTINHGI